MKAKNLFVLSAAFLLLISCGNTEVPASSLAQEDYTSEMISSEEAIAKDFILDATTLTGNKNVYAVNVHGNLAHPEELTMNAKQGFVASNAIKGIEKIVVHTFGAYDNLSVYADVDGFGDKVTSDIDYDEAGNYVFTYDFSASPIDSFRVANESEFEVNFFSITVSYKGELGEVAERDYNDTATTLTVTEALTKCKAVKYGETSVEYYKVTGQVSKLEDKKLTITDGTSSIIVYLGVNLDNVHLEDTLSVKGRLQNYYGTCEITNVEILSVVPAVYTIVVEPTTGGTVTLSKSEGFTYGETVTATFIPETGKKLTKVVLNGNPVDVPAENYLSLTMDRSYVIAATFGDESAKVASTIYETTFDEDGYNPTSSYKHNGTMVGPEGKEWYIESGNVATTDAISGNSIHLRSYADIGGVTVVPMAITMWKLQGMTDVTFEAKASKGNYRLLVDISTDGEASFQNKATLTLTSTAALYSVHISDVGENAQLRFSMECPESGTYAADKRIIIDNVTVKGFAA